jgi:uncharacterized protein (UPF0305 family)
MTNIFEQASREQLRFIVGNSVVSVEALWQLPETTLQSLHDNVSEIANQSSNSKALFSTTRKTSEQKLAELQIALIERVAEVRNTEKQAAKDSKQKADEKARLLEILARKQDNALEELSEEEILQRLENL